MRYHLADDGPKPCKAEKRPCPIGGEHFEGAKAAEEAFAKTFESGGLAGLSNNADGKRSAEVSRQYGHWSIVSDHLHNSSDLGSPAELIYYSTPQGRLELARRIRQNGREEHSQILERIDTEEIPDSYGLNEDAVKERVEAGRKLLRTESQQFDSGWLQEHQDNLRHFLVEESSKWMEKLTPEQQEAVSWTTSNGFLVAQYAIDVKHDYSWMSFQGLVDENAIHDELNDYDKAEARIEEERQAYSANFVKNLHEAFSHAPKLDEPAVIGRGTSIDEVKDLLGANGETDTKKLIDGLIAGDYNGKVIDPNSRMARIPLSASAHPSRAHSFGGATYKKEYTEDPDVVITLKARSFASPVAVGAWGASEYEVFTNPTATYKIVGARRVGEPDIVQGQKRRDADFVLELEEVE